MQKILSVKQLDDLLKDVTIGAERVKQSVFTILDLFNLKLSDVVVYRKELSPAKLFVAAVDECNLEKARKIMAQKYSNITPAPVTVLEISKKYVLFMGSTRCIVFILKGKNPDCLIVKIPDNAKESIIVSEAKLTLKEIIEKQK